MDLATPGEPPPNNDLILRIQKLGSSFTPNIETCQQNILALLGDIPLDTHSTARLITAMIISAAEYSLEEKSSWDMLLSGPNISSQTIPYDGVIFVSAIRALSPTLDWSEVLQALDNPGFVVRTKSALQLLMIILINGIAPNPFPIGLIYRLWAGNKGGQLSLVSQIIHHPDVFYVLDYPHHPVGNLGCLKVFPDESNRAVGMWKCLDLVELIFRLGDIPALTTQVLTLLRRSPGPIVLCPDLLFLGVLQISMPMTQFRVHVLKYLVSVLLSGHSNAVPILQFAWNFENHRVQMRQILFASMAAYYSQNPEDQTRLTRILEITHELKGLSELLSINQFPFVIDLAILAARRDFLKLDKFIEDKLTEHGERFAQDLCQAMRRRCPGLGTNNPLSTETFQLIFSALQPRAASWPIIATELTQLIGQLRSKAIPRTGTSSTSSSSTSFMGGAPPFMPIKMNEGRTSAGTPVIGSGATGHPLGSIGTPSTPTSNPFTLFQQRDQIMRNLRSTPGNEFRSPDFRNLSHLSGSPSHGGNVDFGDDLSTVVFAEEIQEEANSYFQQIYAPNGRMSVAEFISKLKSFKISANPRDRELLLCVIKNLFDEYRFFREYPERELRTTAEVYGGIIREEIVDYRQIQFATAVRRVVESLNDEPGSMLWTFGIIALNSCRAILHKYPKFCEMVVALESFNRFPSGLKDYLTFGVKSQLPPSHTSDRGDITWTSGQSFIPTGGMVPGSFNIPLIGSTQSMSIPPNIGSMKFSAPRGLTAGNSMLNVTNVDILISATERDGTQVKQPPQVVFEKVAFTCNNLCTNNLMEKTQEINELVKEGGDDFNMWFAQYLVMKRVTVEQNFQPLYNSFLMLINNDSLDEFIRKETFRNIDILLKSDKRQAVSNFGDRQLLKNLGHWLGIITIGRDQPVLAKNLDLKYLLIEAFYKGQQELLYIIPFVVKCLTASAKSSIFGPRCAWIYSLLKVLVEIHNEPDLKLNLKFEIEVLCKELSIDLRSVEVGNYLKESSRLPKLLPVKPDGLSPVPSSSMAPLQQPFPPGVSMFGGGNRPASASEMLSNLNISATGGRDSAFSASPAFSSQQALQLSRTSIQAPAVPAFNYADLNIFTQSGLMQNTTIPQHLILFQMHPNLKYLCKNAILHSIKELIGGIADRAISVAITATEHVCRKDFCLDPSEQNIRRAAHQMMRAMTAGMAAITCREPLATTMLGMLKQALCNAIGNILTGSDQAKMVDETAIAVTEANITLATNFIVKSSCEKAVIEIEKRLDSEFVARRLAMKEGRTFQSGAELTAVLEKVPEMIRIQQGVTTELNIKIYDDFSAKICGFKPLVPEERFIEFTRRGQMTTPAAGSGPSRTPTNAFSTPFVPATSISSLPDGRPPTITLPNMLPSHQSQLQHPTAIMGGDRMQMNSSVLFPDENTFNTTNLGLRKMNDEQLLQSKVETILREWITICYTPMAQRDPQHALACIVQMMHDNGVLATDEMITKFFKICADICFDVSYRLLKNESTGQSTVVRQRCYYTLDAFTKLTCLMVKYSDGQHHSTKVNLLKKVLNILSSAVHKDHEQRKFDFNGMPFHRILIIMFNELTAPDPVLDPIQWHILEAFGQTLFLLQPRRVPGFAFHWLDIIGHRNFIGRLLADSFDLGRTGAMYTQLILCHLKFLALFLRNVQLPKPISFIYKGTLRVLLVILHDFPEILCEYHYVLCDAIPPNCVQLRNLILSAYPRDMRLPDPFAENFSKIENFPEMSTNPKTHKEINNIISQDLRKRLDDYLETRSSISFLSDLPTFLQTSLQSTSSTQTTSTTSTSSSQKYNISVVNAVVMYVGVKAIDSINEKKQQKICMESIAHTAFMDIFQNLAVSLCTEGKYLLFNAIANQLRYPNSHTHYFSCTMLYLFLEANSEQIQEQITRILFERLVALRPHPWGLLITFIELIRNPRYNFWKHDFVRCAPEIERLFMSVANSCSVCSIPTEQQQQSNGS